MTQGGYIKKTSLMKITIFIMFNNEIYSDHQQQGFIFHDWKTDILNSTQ